MNDRELLDLYKAEDKRHYAFNLIVDKYGERLYWHIRRMVTTHEDADDLLQNTFIKAWNSLPLFREESGLYTWLYRIATNEAITFVKRAKIRSFLSFDDYYKKVGSHLESDMYFTGSEIQKKLYKAIQRLPKKQRAVFVMRYFEKMKYEDISEILNTTVGALKASYHHAYNKIQAWLLE